MFILRAESTFELKRNKSLAKIIKVSIFRVTSIPRMLSNPTALLGYPVPGPFILIGMEH